MDARTTVIEPAHNPGLPDETSAVQPHHSKLAKQV